MLVQIQIKRRMQDLAFHFLEFCEIGCFSIFWGISSSTFLFMDLEHVEGSDMYECVQLCADQNKDLVNSNVVS